MLSASAIPASRRPSRLGNADHDNTFHFYWEDSWKMKPNFTLNYGLAWNYESNALNHDLTKPTLLAPIFGANNLGPEQHDFKHFSPMVGFAWSPWKDNKTVFRGGAGVYYDTIDIELRLIERAYLSPLGSGYLELGGSSIPNPIPGIPGVPVGTPLDFQTPTLFPGAILIAILPLVRAGVAQQVNFNPNNTDLSVRTIDYRQERHRTVLQRLYARFGAALQPRRAAAVEERFGDQRRFCLSPLPASRRAIARRGSESLLSLHQRRADVR